MAENSGVYNLGVIDSAKPQAAANRVSRTLGAREDKTTVAPPVFDDVAADRVGSPSLFLPAVILTLAVYDAVVRVQAERAE